MLKLEMQTATQRENLPFNWAKLPLDIQGLVIREHLPPSATSTLSQVSQSNRQLVKGEQNSYVRANFKVRQLVIKSLSSLVPGLAKVSETIYPPLSYLYDKYPVLSTLIPVKSASARHYFRQFSEKYDCIIRGKMTADYLYIDGDFHAEFFNPSLRNPLNPDTGYPTSRESVCSFIGTANFDITTGKSELHGDYYIFVDTEEVSFKTKIVFDNGKIDAPYTLEELITDNEAELDVVYNDTEGKQYYVGNHSNIIRSYKSISPYDTESINNLGAKFTLVEEDVARKDDDGSIYISNWQLDTNNELSHVIDVSIRPYSDPNLTNAVKLLEEYNAGEPIRWAVLDHYNEVIIEKRYMVEQATTFRSVASDPYGYLSHTERYGYSEQYPYPLVPEARQTGLRQLVHGTVYIEVRYGPIGDIVSLVIIDLAIGQLVVDYNSLQETAGADIENAINVEDVEVDF